MQTIKVNTKTNRDRVTFYDDKHYAAAQIKHRKSGEFIAYVLGSVSKPFRTLPDAVEFVGDELEKRCASLGLNVEFVNA